MQHSEDELLPRPLVSKVAVAPSIHLNVRTWQGPENPHILLIHGACDGGFVWDDSIPSLLKFSTVSTVDLRGHGDSDHDPSGRYDVAFHAADITTLLQLQSPTAFILVGHSLGAEVAARIAPVLGKQLSGLVLVDAGPGLPAGTASFLREQLLAGHARYNTVAEYARYLERERVLTSSGTLRKVAAKSLRRLSDGGYIPKYDPLIIDMVVAGHDDSWWMPALKEIKAPSIVIRGQASAALSQSVATSMAAALPWGSLALVPRAGHAVMLDNPPGFANALMTFIETHVQTRL